MSETVLFKVGVDPRKLVDASTPKNFGPTYDWRKESWVKGASDAATELGLIIVAALAADGDNPQDEEDCIVRLLVNPWLTMPVIKSPDANDIIRYRVAHAISQLIDEGVKRAKAAGMDFTAPESVFTE